MPPSVLTGSFERSYMATHAYVDTCGDAHTFIDLSHEFAWCAYLVSRAQRLICGQHIINQQAQN